MGQEGHAGAQPDVERGRTWAGSHEVSPATTIPPRGRRQAREGEEDKREQELPTPAGRPDGGRRAVAGGIAVPPPADGTRLGRLSRTRFEMIVEEHKGAMGKLTDSERRQTEAYYRALRDLQ